MAQAPTETKKETMTGGKAVVEALKAEGVDTVFGIISIHMLPVYDALRAEPAIRLLIPRHEMTGGFMADAYYRASGKPGVYLTSTGPGAANSMGAVIESWYCCSKTLHLTGQIESYWLDKGKHALHEVKDQLGMFAACEAVTSRAAKTAEIAPRIHEAMRNLRVGPPRPQVVEIPIDQQYAAAPAEIGPLDAPEPKAPGDAELDAAADLMMKAERPVLWVGGGVIGAGAFEELQILAERLGAAVYLTRGGRGAISEDHPLVVGNYFGERPGRMYLQNSDGILALGTKFSWHTTQQFSTQLTKNLVRVDIDPDVLQNNYPAAVAIEADIRTTLRGLIDRIEAKGHKPPTDAESTIGALKAELREGFRQFRPLTAELIDRIDRATPDEAVLVTDSTIPAYWGANQYLPVRNRRGFMTARLAAIGPGYPMALGAQAADPGRPVLCIAGDGGFVMHIGEFATAVQEKLPVVLVIFNNRGYGVLKKLQKTFMQGREFAVDLHTPDFVAAAKAFGIDGERAETPEALEAAVRRGFSARAPYVIDVVAPFEN
jgi:acetolactate synthase I/II/III large subunit